METIHILSKIRITYLSSPLYYLGPNVFLDLILCENYNSNTNKVRKAIAVKCMRDYNLSSPIKSINMQF